MATLAELKQDLFTYVEKRLGGGIIDVELDPDHYEVAYEKAIGCLLYTSDAADD